MDRLEYCRRRQKLQRITQRLTNSFLLLLKANNATRELEKILHCPGCSQSSSLDYDVKQADHYLTDIIMSDTEIVGNIDIAGNIN